jgi:hypothetical protein
MGHTISDRNDWNVMYLLVSPRLDMQVDKFSAFLQRNIFYAKRVKTKVCIGSRAVKNEQP